jgi:secreted trypsin-like serine protease
MLRTKQKRSRFTAKTKKQDNRVPHLEQLEKRELFTVGAAGTPAAVAAGTGFDGVVQLFVGGSTCTGSLLESGRHILTAAHCVDLDKDGTVEANNIRVRFDLPSGAITLNGMNAANVTIPASWTGSVRNRRADIAIITLPELAPSGAVGADRYGIYRDNDELTQLFTVIGYGRTNQADGTADCTTRNGGTKRLVGNRFDSVNRDTLIFDFDRSDAADAVANEGNTAPGDSGGPSFIDGQIAGVTSAGAPGFGDCSLGDLPYNTRVSNFAGWIDGVVDDPYNLVVDMSNQVPGNDGDHDVIVTRRSGRNLQILVNGEVYHSDTAANIRSVTIRGSHDDETISVQTLFSGRVDAGGGNDTLLAGSMSNRWDITGTNRGTLNTQTRFTGVENLKGGAGGDHFLFGRSNRARISGTINGGGGSDWLDYSRRRSSVTVNLMADQATSAGSVVGIENVKGGSGNDILIGNADNNHLWGGRGNDRLLGGAGDDHILGGAGNDTLKGGTGNDFLDGGSGRNRVEQ